MNIMLKLLGLIDLLGALLHYLVRYDIFHELAIIVGIIISVKAVIFFKDVASIIDLITALILVLGGFGYYSGILAVFGAVWLLQKSFFSLFFY